MNKKIVELSEQVCQTMFNETGYRPNVNLRYQELFAESIVSECIKVAKNYDLPYDESPGMPGNVISRSIKKYFGVE